MSKITRESYESKRFVILEAYRRMIAEADKQIESCDDPSHYFFKLAIEDIKTGLQRGMLRQNKKLDDEELFVETPDFTGLLES